MNTKSEIYSRLSLFVESERNRFSGRHNNMFALSVSQVMRYYEFLAIIFHRYENSRPQFMENKQRLNDSMDEEGPIVLELLAELEKITSVVHLDIESFYLFAKILLDKIAHFLEFYFGQVRGKSLDSHDQVVKNVGSFADAKNLVLPLGFFEITQHLKADIADHRDYEIVHEKSPRTINVTLFDHNGELRISSNRLDPTTKDKDAKSKYLSDLMAEIDKYIELVVQLITLNADKTALRLVEPISDGNVKAKA